MYNTYVILLEIYFKYVNFEIIFLRYQGGPPHLSLPRRPDGARALRKRRKRRAAASRVLGARSAAAGGRDAVCRGWGVACWGNYWESGHLRICYGKARPVSSQAVDRLQNNAGSWLGEGWCSSRLFGGCNHFYDLSCSLYIYIYIYTVVGYSRCGLCLDKLWFQPLVCDIGMMSEILSGRMWGTKQGQQVLTVETGGEYGLHHTLSLHT